ncbi:MAG TPA: copper chaperone PCu(A)C [Pseudolabrys sp.]|nr:copper chaperone PCu(A)C [Pseudolabrys sp.]
MKVVRARILTARVVNHRPLQSMALCAVALVYALAGTPVKAAGGITVEQPWMRFIIKARPAGGYFTLHNNTAKAAELTGASSSACGMVMLHQTKTVNGIEKMLPVKSVAVPPHGTLKFQPGSYHLMCMKPKDTMVVGHKVPVTLKFAGGRTLTAQFSVQGVGGK